MAIAFVNRATATAHGSGSTVVTAAQNHTTGNLLVVGVKWEGGGITVNSVTDTAGNTYTPLTARNNGGGDPSFQAFYAKNITGNASNILTATFSNSSPNFTWIAAFQYSGCDTSAPFDQENFGSGTSTSGTTGSITTTLADEVLVSFTALAGGVTSFTPGSGYTERWDGPVDSGIDTGTGEDQIVSSISTYTASESWVGGSAPFVITIQSFKIQVAVNPVPPQPEWPYGKEPFFPITSRTCINTPMQQQVVPHPQLMGQMVM
jgi:hypothetical protein